MKRVSFSPFRVGLIARNTLREAIRQRLFHFIALVAFTLVVGAQGLRDFNFGSSELKFIADLGFGAMAFFGAVLTIAATAQLFFSEIEHRTALTLLAKPVWRAEFVLGKLLGVAVVTAAFCVLMMVLLMAVLWWRESTLMRDWPEAFGHGRAIDYAALGAAGFAQWLKLVVLAALTMLVASFAKTQLYTMVMGFFVLVICHLQYFAQEAIARGGSAVLRTLAGLLSLVFPNFQLFDFSESVAAGSGIIWSQVVRVTFYGLGYAAAVCALASFSFRRREI